MIWIDMFPVIDKSNDVFSVTDDIHSGDLFLLRKIRIWRVA